jgi:hypothetical protein
MDSPPHSPIPDATPSQPPAGVLRDLLGNLRTGLRVAQFKPVARRQFSISRTQALTLLGIAVLLTLIYVFAVWPAFWLLPYALESGWLSTLLASILLPFVTAYASSVFIRDPAGFNAFAVIGISSMMLPAVAYVAITGATTLAAQYVISEHTPIWVILLPYGAMIMLLLWSLGILVLCIRITYRLTGMRSALLSLLLLCAFLSPGMIFGWHWHPAEQSTAEPAGANENGG